MNTRTKNLTIFILATIIIFTVIFVAFNLPDGFKKHFEEKKNFTINMTGQIYLSSYDSKSHEKIKTNYILFDKSDKKMSEGQLLEIERIDIRSIGEICKNEKKEIKYDIKKAKKCEEQDLIYCNPEYPEYAYCENGEMCCETECLHRCEPDKYWDGDECICKKDFRLITWSDNYYLNEIQCSLNSECISYNRKIGEIDIYGKSKMSIVPNSEYNSKLYFQAKDGEIDNLIICVKRTIGISRIDIDLPETEVPENYRLYDNCYAFPEDLKILKMHELQYKIETNENSDYERIEFLFLDSCSRIDNGRTIKEEIFLNAKDICMKDKIYEIIIYGEN